MDEPEFELLLTHARLATMQPGRGYGEIADGAVATLGDRIVWCGAMADLPARHYAQRSIDCRGALVTPGLIDCHTHLVFAGNRAHEFEMRLNGASYAEIARAGGGIRSTVAATRAADEHALFTESIGRMRSLVAEGVTTVEIKSGYGLDLHNELKMLRVARFLSEACPVTTVPTLLGAHALPEEFEGRADDYISLVCDEMIPTVARLHLAEAVDAFCENIGFTAAQTARVFECAARHGLRVRLHADQLTDSGGAALAAHYRALSADHLEYASEPGVAALAAAGAVAVLLPGAFYFLRETRLPPIDALRRHKVPMAVASDCNPGTAPIPSLLANLHMSCTLFRLTPLEALQGVTIHAAAALGLAQECGSIESGKRADLALWNVKAPGELAYWLGGVRPDRVVYGGRLHEH